jgi:hypothetical protein
MFYYGVNEGGWLPTHLCAHHTPGSRAVIGRPPPLKSIVFSQRDFLSFCGSAEGDYSCLGGWSSLIGINVKPFLRQKPPNRIFMRLGDWWPRDYQVLIKNWGFADAPDILLRLVYQPLPRWHK